VYRSKSDRSFVSSAGRERLETDLHYSVQVERFDFAMPVERRDGLWVMQAKKM
jgi:hypothetical protein